MRALQRDSARPKGSSGGGGGLCGLECATNSRLLDHPGIDTGRNKTIFSCLQVSAAAVQQVAELSVNRNRRPGLG